MPKLLLEPALSRGILIVDYAEQEHYRGFKLKRFFRLKEVTIALGTAIVRKSDIVQVTRRLLVAERATAICIWDTTKRSRGYDLREFRSVNTV